MKYPENYRFKIRDIVREFNLYNKKEGENLVKAVFNDPVIILTRLMIKYGKENLTEEDILSYLKKRLDISNDKAETLRDRLEEDLFSKINPSSDDNIPDRYRESVE